MPACLPNTDRLPLLKLAKVEPILLRAKIDTPIVTSFGNIPERAVLLVRVEDTDGAVGWGEVFGNFPVHGAENRAHLIRDFLSSIALSETWASPAAAFAALTRKTHIMTLQAGEPGPFAQAIAGVDIALWDLAARRLDTPLWRLMGGARDTVPTYASGLNPSGFEGIVEQKLAEGYNAFKIKIGFGQETDFAALKVMRTLIGKRALMTDVNQGWDLDTACANWQAYSDFGLGWIEEPLPADATLADWKQVAACGGAPIAAGENLIGDDQFDAHIASGALAVVQPDMCKWGGFSKTLPLACRIVGAGLRYCPHFLAGPVGILAAAHCLAAAGGEGILEVDANPNPLRDQFTGGLPEIIAGNMTLPAKAGLGIEPDTEYLKEFKVN